MQQGELRACPNCGASNRATAKFCVTCGVKMPEAPPPARDPYTSTPATSTWPAPPAAPDPAPAAGGWGNIGDAPAPVTVPAAAPDPTPAPSWGGWGNAAPAAAVDPANDPAAVVEGLEEAFDDDDVAAAAAFGAAVAAQASDDAPAGDALAQAHELLDMLRDLLPAALAPGATAAAGVDPSAVLADTSSDNYAALRGLIVEATDRPRDIDVMMRLSQQVADIAALMDERDRLRAALQGFDLRQGS